MSRQSPLEMSKKRVVYQLPGGDSVNIRRDVEYHTCEAGPLKMDLYYPPSRQEQQSLPAVVIVTGYPDPGFQKIFGCKFKEMGSTVSWAQLAATSGIVGITYENREPTTDLHQLFQHVNEACASLGIDSTRIGIWASSGHVPLALSLLMLDAPQQLKCAALLYGYTLDLEGDAVSQAEKLFRFVNPSAGRTVEDLEKDVPLLIVRAGRDELPGLNPTLELFISKALGANLPLTVVNHPTAPHAFDLLDDTDDSREIIRVTLEFLRFHLSA